MGIRDSSLTRVQPVFDALYASDQTGGEWLLNLLQMGSRSAAIAPDFYPGQLTKPPQYEFPAPPSREFLRHLLNNPSQLTVPQEATWRTWGAMTQTKRRALLSGDDQVRQEALNSLNVATDLKRKTWWCFEGTTSVDCALFTERLVLFIEANAPNWVRRGR